MRNFNCIVVDGAFHQDADSFKAGYGALMTFEAPWFAGSA